MNLNQSYYYTKENVSAKEYRIYKYLDNMKLKFIPKLYSYDKEKKILKTQRINSMCVSDLYGENFKDVPENVIEKIRDIVRYLHNIGIIYPDITGYNFIEDKQSRIWVVDFEHCFYINNYNRYEIKDDNEDDIKDKDEHLDFVNRFCYKNEMSWNLYFA
jgi:tRNA A-37 threonylcarbamoyl transferase component Bud32